MLYPLLGGNADNGAVCRSRTSNWTNRALNLNWYYGRHGTSDTRVSLCSHNPYGWTYRPWYFTKIQNREMPMASSKKVNVIGIKLK